MSLIPYDPFQFLKQLQMEMDRLFHPSTLPFRQDAEVFSIQLHETEKEIIAICKVPGLKRLEEMEIEMNGQLLTVGRRMSSSYELKGKDMYKSQQYSGYYCKTLSLPCPVGRWSTTFKDEELKIHMEKRGFS